MARQYTVKIGVDLITINFQRNSTDNPDSDFLTMWVTTSRDPNSRYSAGPVSIGGSLSSGQTVTLNPALETAEFIVTDNDLISVKFYGVNQSHTDSTKAISDGLKIAAGVLAALVAGEVLATMNLEGKGVTKFFNKDEAIAAVIAGAIALAAEFIGDLAEALGFSSPDCDGPVFDPGSEMLFKVGDLVLALEAEAGGRLTVGVPLPLGVWTDDTQISQKGCGHNPSTTLRPIITFTTDPIPEQVFPPSLNDPPVKTDALVGQRPQAWVNTWSDQAFAENSSIVVKITQEPAAVSHFKVSPILAPEFRAAATRFKDRILNNKNLGALLGTSPVAVNQTTTSVASDGELHVEVTEKFVGTHRVALQTTVGSLAAIPMNSFPVGKPLLQLDSVLHSKAVFIDDGTPTPGTGAAKVVKDKAAGVQFSVDKSQSVKTGGAFSQLEIGGSKTASATSTGHAGGAGVAGATAAASLLTPMYADSVVVGQGVSLQFFGAFDKHNHIVGTRLRYLHVDANQKILTDVMLQPASVPIK